MVDEDILRQILEQKLEGSPPLNEVDILLLFDEAVEEAQDES
jgi:hypothetical protein